MEMVFPHSLTVNRTAEPQSLAVTLAELKDHLLVSGSDDDTLLTSILNTAIREAEQITGKQLFTATYVAKMDNFPHCSSIALYWPPLATVTSITYYDTESTLQTLSTSVYDVDTSSLPGRITLKYGQYWPNCRGYINDVTITYTAGCLVANIPETIKSGIKLLAQAHYDPIRSGNADEAKVMREAGERLLMMERCQSL